jgi:multimeric flavodoxin WrbA
MKAIILNGSPKGEKSYTLQYVRYLEKAFPGDSFDVIHLGKKIKHILKNDAACKDVLDRIAAAELVFWTYPVYYLMVPGQVKQFIEKVFSENVAACFTGKYTTYLSTSAHYYDHTAHNYLQAVCEDLDMKFLPGFSAATYDMLSYNSDNPLACFWNTIQAAIQNDHVYPRVYDEPKPPPKALKQIKVPIREKDNASRVCLITDHTSESNPNLQYMIELFQARCPYPVDVINISSQNIKGGCLGCMQCAYDGTCIYKDDYLELFNKTVKTAKTIVYAGTIIDRYFSADLKLYFDRNFFNGHRPIYSDKQTLFLISGNLKANMNLRELLIGQVETWTMEILGFVSDEVDSSEQVLAHIDTMCMLVQSRTEHYWKAPNTFLGVGARKLFRDLVYEHRGIMCADYTYYRDNGLLDFPNHDYPARLKSRILRTASQVPSIRKTIQKSAIEKGLEPLKNKVAATSAPNL